MSRISRDIAIQQLSGDSEAYNKMWWRHRGLGARQNSGLASQRVISIHRGDTSKARFQHFTGHQRNSWLWRHV